MPGSPGLGLVKSSGASSFRWTGAEESEELTTGLGASVETVFLTVSRWSGSAKVLGKFPVPGRPTIWITVGQGPTALTVVAGGGCLVGWLFWA